MSRKIRVLFVPSTGEPVTMVIEDTHEVLCTCVGDINTDTVMLTATAALVFVGAHSKQHPLLDPNPLATRLVERFLPGFAASDQIHGPVVITGVDASGDRCDAPAEVVEFAGSLTRNT